MFWRRSALAWLGRWLLLLPLACVAWLGYRLPNPAPIRSELRLVDKILEKGVRPGGRYYRIRADNGREYTLWRESGWAEGRWLLDPPRAA